MPGATIQFFASPEAMENAMLARGAAMSVPERLRELRRLNEQIFAPLHQSLQGHPVETQLFRRLPGELDDDFIRRVAHEKEQWTYSIRKARH